MNLLKDECPPTMLLHGDTDTQVPPRQSEELYRALTVRGIQALSLIHILSQSEMDMSQTETDMSQTEMDMSPN